MRSVVLVLFVGGDELLDSGHGPAFDVDVVDVLVLFQKCYEVRWVVPAFQNALPQVFLFLLHVVLLHFNLFIVFG